MAWPANKHSPQATIDTIRVPDLAPAAETWALARSIATWRDPVFALVVLVCLVALICRLYKIDHESLWLDEGYTLLFSGLPLSKLLLVGGAHEHPPLYYLIVHVVMGLRSSYLTPRVISAVAGTASILVLYLLGRRLFGRAEGVVAALLLAVSPFHLWYSRDGRAYELAGLLVLLSYLMLLVALDRPRKRLWLAYGVCLSLTLYTEYTTLLVLLPQGLLLIQARRRGLARQLAGAWLLAALLFAPWLVTLGQDVASVVTDYWIPTPTSGMLVNTVLEFLGLLTPCSSYPCTGSQAALPLLTGHQTVITELATAAAVMVGIGAWYRRNLVISVLSLWLLLPFAIVLALSLRRPLYLDRVFLDATFPLYLLLGAAAASLFRRLLLGAAGVALALAIAIASLANGYLIYATSSNPDWQSAVRDLSAAYRPGQGIVYNPAVLRSIMHAYVPHTRRLSREWPLWFHGYLDVPGWRDRYRGLQDSILGDSRLLASRRYGVLDGELRDRELVPASRTDRCIWLLTLDYAGLNDTRHWFLAHGYHLLLSEIYSGDTRIELWERAGPSDIGPAVVGPGRGQAGWSQRGEVRFRGATIAQRGEAVASRSFPVRAGSLYVVAAGSRVLPPASASISLQTYDSHGQVVGHAVDAAGDYLDSFPRTEWYDLPATGAWLRQPFGFVAPPGATHATLWLRSWWGEVRWRDVAVYRER